MHLFYYTKHPIEIKGRFLGFITDKEFAIILKESKKIARKLASGKTIQLRTLKNIPNSIFINKRVLFVTNRWDKPIKNSIFISNKISTFYGQSLTINGHLSEISFLDDKDVCLTISTHI